MIRLFSIASEKSIWRGIDYYEKKKVKTCQKESETIYTGSVEGSEDQLYEVKIDLDHPKRSTCTCPFAEGRRVVCKHMNALACESVPEAYEEFMDDMADLEEEERLERENHLRDLKKYVYSLKKDELRKELYDALLELEEYDSYQW